ncbi:MAG: winged helix-turn-helix transcriptional regulator [Methanomassiliicoccales archaeon]|nr:winged helix-turn-helix transcriptional regulator [Methanomassiliicoccales archaeon]NYT15384.1 winged helix-turn-helix transcriptional regulator [Methanomassiliicoccales archaeon]
MIDNKLDREILQLLQKNGKLTYEEISKKVGSPPSTIRDRIKRMEENRLILGYSTIIDEERVGMAADAYIAADVPPERISEAFAALFSMERVSEILKITGQRRIMFRIKAVNNEELMSIIDRDIRPLGFDNIEIKVVLDHLIRYPGL